MAISRPRVRLFPILLVLALVYLAWPYFTLYKLAVAIQEKDAVTLDGLVAWPSVREGLKADLNVVVAKSMAKNSANDASGGAALGTALAATLLPAMINQMVDAYVTPQGLVALAENGGKIKPPGELRRPPSGATPVERDVSADGGSEKTTADELAKRVRYAFFTGPAAFRVEMSPPKDDGSKPLIAIFRLEDFRWQLTRVFLPLPAE